MTNPDSDAVRSLMQTTIAPARAELTLIWDDSEPLGGEACRCHEAIVRVQDRAWDVRGAVRGDGTVRLLEHVCEGRLGRRVRSRAVASQTGQLYFDRAED